MELIRILLGNEEFICFYAPVSVWSVIEWMMSHAIGNFEEREAMLADDLKAVQRKIVKDSFADKMAALKKQEAEFSDLVSDLFALRSLHDSLQEKNERIPGYVFEWE